MKPSPKNTGNLKLSGQEKVEVWLYSFETSSGLNGEGDCKQRVKYVFLRFIELGGFCFCNLLLNCSLGGKIKKLKIVRQCFSNGGSLPKSGSQSCFVGSRLRGINFVDKIWVLTSP